MPITPDDVDMQITPTEDDMLPIRKARLRSRSVSSSRSRSASQSRSMVTTRSRKMKRPMCYPSEPRLLVPHSNIRWEKMEQPQPQEESLELSKGTAGFVCAKDWLVLVRFPHYKIELKNSFKPGRNITIPPLKPVDFLMKHSRHAKVWSRDDPIVSPFSPVGEIDAYEAWLENATDYISDSEKSDSNPGGLFQEFAGTTIRKFIMYGDPASQKDGSWEDNYYLVAIFNPSYRLKISLAYWTPSSPEWVPLVSCIRGHPIDATFSAGKLFVFFDWAGQFLQIFDFIGEDNKNYRPPICRSLLLPFFMQLKPKLADHFCTNVVDNFGDVLIISRSVEALTFEDGEDECSFPLYFRLFKISPNILLDQDRADPEEVWKLKPNTAIFLGANAPFSVRVDVNDGGVAAVKPNCIYFTDGKYCTGKPVVDSAYYNLSTRTVHRLLPYHDANPIQDLLAPEAYFDKDFEQVTPPQWI